MTDVFSMRRIFSLPWIRFISVNRIIGVKLEFFPKVALTIRISLLIMIDLGKANISGGIMIFRTPIPFSKVSFALCLLIF